MQMALHELSKKCTFLKVDVLKESTANNLGKIEPILAIISNFTFLKNNAV